jgi:hypothetical protein
MIERLIDPGIWYWPILCVVTFLVLVLGCAGVQDERVLPARSHAVAHR